MVGRKLPPFTAVRAFEAVARHLNIEEGASDLCLTPQIKTLEDYFDTALFERRANKLQTVADWSRICRQNDFSARRFR